MLKIFLKCSLTLIMLVAPLYAQEPVDIREIEFAQEKAIQAPSTIPTALAAYAKWREATLPNFAQKELTPHYAVSIVAQRLDEQTAQVEMVLAAEMKHYTITVKPVTLVKLATGEYGTAAAGKAVTFDQKAGKKLTTGPDAIRLGDWTTTVAVDKTAQALEITWEPKNDKKDDPSNTVLVLLGKEAAVVVNGYVHGEPVK